MPLDSSEAHLTRSKVFVTAAVINATGSPSTPAD
mgnify:CR=1 FL=1